VPEAPAAPDAPAAPAAPALPAVPVEPTMALEPALQASVIEGPEVGQQMPSVDEDTGLKQ
jgi:hypothetical protein